MRQRSLLVIATVAAVCLAAQLPAEAARTPTFRVTLTTSTTTSDVGTTVTLRGAVRGPKSARKTLLIQRRIGASQWTTIARTRTGPRSRYVRRVTTTTAGVQSLRVIAPRSTKAKRGTSAARMLTGWRWLDLTTQSQQAAGDVRGPVTVNGVSYGASYVFQYNGVHFKTGRSCTTLRTQIAVPDGTTQDARLAVFTSPNGALDWDRATTVEVWAGAAALTREFPVQDTYLSLGFGGGDKVAALNPQVRCAAEALPTFDLASLPAG